jgi:hypothetical protein
MAIGRVMSWMEGDVLSATDLNAEFNNITQAGIDLVSPLLTGESLDLNGEALILDPGGTSSFTTSTNGQTQLTLLGVKLFEFDGRTASSVNGLTWKSGETAVAPTITAISDGATDDNVDINLVPLGDGHVQIAGIDFNNIATLHYSTRYYGS